MKRIISFLLVAVMLTAIVPFAALNVSAGNGGECGDGLTWSFSSSDGILHIDGYGYMEDYDNESYRAPWYGDAYDITSIQVSDNVMQIGEYAFAGLFNVETVTLPASYCEMGVGAFWGCSKLKTITLPANIICIPDLAFYNCEKLESITLPDSVGYIGCNCFQLSGLKSINIPAYTYAISSLSFAGCNALETITVDENNERYDSRNYCNAIICTEENSVIAGCKNTVIPSDVAYIADFAFYCNTGLTEITIPGSVDLIGENAFAYCSNLTTVVIAKGELGAVCKNAFYGCSSISNVSYGGSNKEWLFIYFYDGNDDLLSHVSCASTVSLKKGWNKDSMGWFYLKNDGTLAKEQWVKDSKGWCYLSYDGYIITDDVVNDSKGMCYVDESGYWVTKPGWHTVYKRFPDLSSWVYIQKGGYLKTECWVKDSKGWCYLGYYGIMEKNGVLSDKNGLCYIDNSGYWVTKQGWHCIKNEFWGDMWVYVQKNGYLKTESWMKDSKGWCYLGDSGYMLSGTIIEDSKGLCYLDDSGHWVTKKGWLNFYEFWIYIEANGYVANNKWINDGKGKGDCYVDENGFCYMSCIYDARLIGEDGYAITEAGWHEVGTDMVFSAYVNEYGYVTCNAWVHDGEGWCWLDDEGYKVYGRIIRDSGNGNLYYVDMDGHQFGHNNEGLQSVWVWDAYTETYVMRTVYIKSVSYALAENETLLYSYIVDDDPVKEEYKVARDSWEFDSNGYGKMKSSYYDYVTYEDYAKYGLAVG